MAQQFLNFLPLPQGHGALRGGEVGAGRSLDDNRLAALAHLRSRRGSLEKASQYASKAVDLGRTATSLAALAEVEFAGGDPEKAIFLLEEVLPHGGARIAHAALLDKYRRAFLPDLASYASVDWFVIEVLAEAADRDHVLRQSEEALKLGGAQERLSYLGARLLELQGDLDGATEILSRLSEDSPQDLQLLFSLIRVLRSAERFEEAQNRVREELLPGRHAERAPVCFGHSSLRNPTQRPARDDPHTGHNPLRLRSAGVPVVESTDSRERESWRR